MTHSVNRTAVPIVNVNNLSFSFGEGDLCKQILFDISFNVSPGEIVLLTGPSGSGKTTILTLVGGLRHVKTGELTVLGTDFREASIADLVRARRQIGFIFQAHNLLDFLSAKDNVAMAMQLHPEVTATESRERVRELLEMVGLKDRMDYYPAKLSGGQRQRVAIARALVGRPQLVLADEPTAALDSHSGREVVELLQRLATDHGAAILMVTHDNRVLNVADRIVEMEDGRIKQAANSR
jgi:putative ABC transport system ATP-binding protein